jgi:hypothetical protein
MAANMVKSGELVVVYDINEAAVTKLKVVRCIALPCNQNVLIPSPCTGIGGTHGIISSGGCCNSDDSSHNAAVEPTCELLLWRSDREKGGNNLQLMSVRVARFWRFI